MRRQQGVERQRDGLHHRPLDWHEEMEATQPRFAVGTREIDKLPPADIEEAPSSERDVMRAAEVVQIVHDLKNPLATIALEMCLLGEKLVDTAPADVTRAIARVLQNVSFLDRMVQDILDLSAIDMGSLVLQCRPIDLRELAEHVIDRAVPSRDRPRVFLDAECSATVVVDELRLERVLANLLQNALKYAPRDSGIVVRVERTALAARISVIDAGPGLSDDDASHIFEQYRRGDQANGHEGSGLGLYVAKRIVEAHGGTIGVESVRTIGSRFFFEIPAA